MSNDFFKNLPSDKELKEILSSTRIDDTKRLQAAYVLYSRGKTPDSLISSYLLRFNSGYSEGNSLKYFFEGLHAGLKKDISFEKTLEINQRAAERNNKRESKTEQKADRTRTSAQREVDKTVNTKAHMELAKSIIRGIKVDKNDILLKVTLMSIAIGIWAIVFQNAGIISKSQEVRVVNTIDAYVKGGNIEADVSGNVWVDNEVDVDIKKVNGWNAANYYEYTIEGQEFHSIGTR